MARVGRPFNLLIWKISFGKTRKVLEKERERGRGGERESERPGGRTGKKEGGSKEEEDTR